MPTRTPESQACNVDRGWEGPCAVPAGIFCSQGNRDPLDRCTAEHGPYPNGWWVLGEGAGSEEAAATVTSMRRWGKFRRYLTPAKIALVITVLAALGFVYIRYF